MPTLPPDSFFMTEYLHRQSGTLRQDVYFEDGRVMAFDGTTWTPAFQLTGEQVADLKSALRSSGLMAQDDLRAPDTYDTAAFTYVWHLDDQEGQVTNWAYPALSRPSFDRIDTLVSKLELAAGA